jgi:hypothetical protein
MVTVALPHGWILQNQFMQDGVVTFGQPKRPIPATQSVDGIKYDLYFIPRDSGQTHYRIAAHPPYFFSVTTDERAIALNIEGNTFVADIPQPQSIWQRLRDLFRRHQ